MAYHDDYDVGSEDLGEYVPVIYARSADEAEKYRQLLEDHGIPAVIDEDYEPGEAHSPKAGMAGVPVLVPESLLEDARQFVAEIDELTALHAEDEEPYDEDDEDDFGTGEGYVEDKAVGEGGFSPLEEEDLEEEP